IPVLGKLLFYTTSLPVDESVLASSQSDVPDYLYTTPSRKAYPSQRERSRRHCRLVHADPPGILLANSINYDQILLAVHGAFEGQRASSNVSVDNILLSADGSRGVLIDFEHIKRFNESALSGPPRSRSNYEPIGHSYSMSLEVERARYMFIPEPKYDLDKEYCPPPTPPPWFRNPLHDVESIWWILVWATLHFIETGILDEYRE
ncbi:10701_t:CDS:2, partial [Acaulospora colombiana]